ncbi:MAG: hypothetical protein IRY85_09980 [Micromonosporaceae bacterium]|nr:hypothetical protein [Micromonosporaceae bacterium]
MVSNLDLVFATRCDTPMWIEVRVAGRDELVASSCRPDGSSTWRLGPELLASLGAVPGEPVTYTATVTDGVGPNGSVDLPVPEHGTFALAVMQRVPFEEYPLPPRPETLPSLDEQIPPDTAFEMRSDPLDLDRPVSRTLAWSADAQLHILTTTPGFVHLSINGTRVATHENWGYDVAETVVRLGDEAMPQFAEGAVVIITAEPEHITGEWAIWSTPTVPGPA